MAILVAATGSALTWLAQAPAPGRAAGEPEPPGAARGPGRAVVHRPLSGSPV